MELLIIKDTYEIPIPLLIRNNSFSFIYKNFIRGYYVYMKVWTPLLGEWLFGKQESSNRVDKNAVVLIRLNSCGKEEVVSHFPQNISKVVSFYLSLPHCYLEVEVTGNVWTVVVAMDLKFRQGFVFTDLKLLRE